MTQDFRGLTVKARGGLLRSIVSDCKACAAFDPNNTPTSKQPKYKNFKAIWDTGATNSVITQAVVDACGLKATGMTQVHGVMGTDSAETFLVNLLLPNAVEFVSVEVTLGKLAGPADMLLGMDIITNGDFSITNVGGETVFSFRIPSLETIDYVKEANALKADALKRTKRKAERRTKRSQKGRPWSR